MIDRLALRNGGEKDADEADTVGACSLRVEHISFSAPDKREVTLDFLGKDSIRYHNTVVVDKEVFANLQKACKGKKKDAALFDLVTPTKINEFFHTFMPDLTAKVFRTYNASKTLQDELLKLGSDYKTADELYAFYTDANRAVAILCNHQRSVPKQHEEMAQKLTDKIDVLKEELRELKVASRGGDPAAVKRFEMKKQAVAKQEAALVMKEENKTVALGTSRLNYMDPRITVAFCKRVELSIEKVFSRTHREKFPWAMHSASTWRF